MKAPANERVSLLSSDCMGLSFNDLINPKELDDGVGEPRLLKTLCLKCFFIRLHIRIWEILVREL